MIIIQKRLACGVSNADVAGPPSKKQWSSPWPVFITAALLLALLEGLLLVVEIYLRPPIVQWLGTLVSPPDQLAFLGNEYGQELFSSLVPLFILIFDPVVFFLVFYWLGKRMDFDVSSRYVLLAGFAFGGGLLGSLVSLAEIIATGGSFGTGGLVASTYLNLASFVVESAMRITLTAFAGVVIGRWRATRTDVSRTEIASLPPGV